MKAFQIDSVLIKNQTDGNCSLLIFLPNELLGQPSLRKAASFDMLTFNEMGLYAESEAIYAAISSLSELQLASTAADELVLILNHAGLVDIIFGSLSDVSELDLVQLRNLLKDDRPSKWNQYSVYSNYGISRKLYESIAVFDLEDDVNAVFEKLRILLPSSRELDRLFRHLKRLESQLRALGVQSSTLLAPLFIPSNFKYYQDGIVFKVVRKIKRTSSVILSGGRYDSLIRTLQYPGKKLAFPSAIGFTIDLELLDHHQLEGADAHHRIDVLLVALGSWNDTFEVLEMVSNLRSSGITGMALLFNF